MGIAGHDLVVKQATNQQEVASACEIETGIFQQCGFVSLKDYQVYLDQSHFFGGFERAGQCRGVVRIIEGSPLLPPVIRDMKVTESGDGYRALAATGRFEEFATIAIEEDARGLDLFLDLVRIAYRDARRRGVTHFGIIMEPQRVEMMNQFYDFCYTRVGPDQRYGGEDHVTAPFVLDFEEQERHLRDTRPAYLKWFVHDPLRPRISGLETLLTEPPRNSRSGGLSPAQSASR